MERQMIMLGETWIIFIFCQITNTNTTNNTNTNDDRIKNVRLGHSGNWTRDLSHPKRESYH